LEVAEYLKNQSEVLEYVCEENEEMTLEAFGD